MLGEEDGCEFLNSCLGAREYLRSTHPLSLRGRRVREVGFRVKKKIIINILKVGVTVAIIYFIFQRFQIGFDDIVASLQHEPVWFLAALAAQAGAITFSIMRWKVLLAG